MFIIKSNKPTNPLLETEMHDNAIISAFLKAHIIKIGQEAATDLAVRVFPNNDRALILALAKTAL